VMELTDKVLHEKLTFIRQELESQSAIDPHILSNLKADTYLNDMMFAQVITFRTWFVDRKLTRDFSYRYPKNYFHLMLFFMFFWWQWFKDSVIKWEVIEISVKEAYGNIAMPDKNPILFIDRIKNNQSVTPGPGEFE